MPFINYHATEEQSQVLISNLIFEKAEVSPGFTSSNYLDLQCQWISVLITVQQILDD